MPKRQFTRDQKQAIRQELESAGMYRGLQVRNLGPVTAVREEDGEESMRWVLTTEKAATVFDWQRWDFVDEILLMDGVVLPENKQIPFLDSHRRGSVDDVLGSVTDFQELAVSGFGGLDGKVRFAADEKSQRTKQKALDGHLTDGSVGYEVLKSIWIPEGESAKIAGRTFEGPVKVSYKWALKEFSGTPIGADSLAKVRSFCAGDVCRLV